MNEGHSAAWDQEWDKAIASYRKALEEFPDQPKALNSLGLALYQVGQFEEALQTYQYVAKLSPNDPVPFEKVAQLSERLGDLKMAVEAAMRAADLYLNQRDADKALENWVRVTTLNPEHAAAHSRLALVHEKHGLHVDEQLKVAELAVGEENTAVSAAGRVLLPDDRPVLDLPLAAGPVPDLLRVLVPAGQRFAVKQRDPLAVAGEGRRDIGRQANPGRNNQAGDTDTHRRLL